MTFLKHLQDTKFSELSLLDFAYIVVLLPLVGLLKTPMIFFSIISLLLIVFKRKPASNLSLFSLFIVGVLALYLSMYGTFSFSGLSRLKLFLELLIYILIIVVALQRLTQTINFYLLISPFLFLALSLFFYHGIVMLSYVIFEVFVLLWMILSHRMSGDITEGFKGSMVMFLYSLPWVVLLFIFFPRISFEHANYGFKGEVTKRMGHDGTMYLDGNALLVPSDRIVMEIGFEGEVPDDSQLYFRGSVLYIDKNDHWEPLQTNKDRRTLNNYNSEINVTGYKVTLYPTQKKWLYLLDMPNNAVEKSTLDSDLISTVEKNIEEPLHYLAHSSLSRRYKVMLDEVTHKASTLYHKTKNPKSYQHAERLKAQHSTTASRATALTSFFKAQSLTYTLKPDALDTNKTTDSFLFEKKRGYCVHFASSYVTMARMLDIPARVVTGYKADKSEGINNYLAIKEKNAHAWAELYIDGHWVRYETTSTASNIDLETQTLAVAAQKQNEQNQWLKKINLYLMYTKYKIETWILHYSHLRQLQLLDYAKKNPNFVMGFITGIFLLIMGSFLMASYFRAPSYSSKALKTMQSLLKSLKKHGYEKKPKESMHQFLLHVISVYPHNDTLKNIDRLYEKTSYAQSETDDVKKLKKYIKSFQI